MANILVRTAHSTFVKETEDFTTGLTTPEGQTFASPIDLGGHVVRGARLSPCARLDRLL